MPFFSKEKTNSKDTAVNQDAILVQRACEGDSDSFGKLVEKYESFVYRTVFYDIKNREDAEDIAQEVFIKAYRALNSFRADSEFSTWIYRICKNTVYDYMRKNSKAKTIPLSEMSSGDDNDREYEIADESGKYDPEKTAISKETASLVNLAISKLSEEHRNIIVMRDIEGYSYSEIADFLGLEEGTVKSRLSRAREALKKQLIALNVV